MTKHFFIFFIFFLTNSQTNRVDNVCSTKYIKRIFLGLGESGTITAYNITYEGLTNRSFHCQMEIITCPSCRVSLNFTLINLNCYYNFIFSGYNSCRCDYVWVTEPPYDSLGVSFCQSSFVTRRNSGYKSKTKTVRISFFYSRTHIHAFTIDYKSEPNRQTFFGVSQPPLNLNYTGLITSPFFPAFYPRDLVVEYVLTCLKPPSDTDIPMGDENCRIRLAFKDFQLASSSLMEFYDGGRRVRVVTGNSFRPSVFVTNTNTLTIRFYASKQNNIGFKAIYTFIPDNITNKMLAANTDCGGFVDNIGGTITMMKMVHSQIGLFDCFWIIKPLKKLYNPKPHVALKVVSFVNFVGYGVLEIRQGLTSESPLLEKINYPSSRGFSEHIVPITTGYYVSLTALFSSASRFAFTYASFSHNKCFVFSEFQCKNYRCISKKLVCDGYDHCGDDSDEPNLCYKDWALERGVERWYTQTPNYYFPKIHKYTDFKTASIIFLVSFVALIFFISALTITLYHIRSRNRRERNFQERIQSISDFQDFFSDEGSIENIVIDDPPSYEFPPNYDEVVKGVNEEVLDKQLCVLK